MPIARERSYVAVAVRGDPQRLPTGFTHFSEGVQGLLVRRHRARTSASHLLSPAEGFPPTPEFLSLLLLPVSAWLRVEFAIQSKKERAPLQPFSATGPNTVVELAYSPFEGGRLVIGGRVTTPSLTLLIATGSRTNCEPR